MDFTKLLQEIKSGKYNLIIFIICFIFLYHIFDKISSCKKNIENMTTPEAQINAAIKRIYESDEFIKQISAAAAQVRKDGLKITGDLTVTGNIKASGDVSNGKFSLNALNTRVDAIK